MANKTTEVELIEKFIRLEHKLGKSNSEIADRLQRVAAWFMETQMSDEIDTRLEREVASKVSELANRALERYVGRVLDNDT